MIHPPEKSSSSSTKHVTASNCSIGMARDSGSWPRDSLHTAHICSSPKIHYPFHPLFGKEIDFIGSVGGKRDMAYVRLPNKTTKGIPAWMLDEAACAHIRTAIKPTVDPQALLKLAALLDSVRAPEGKSTDEPTVSTKQEGAAGDNRA